MYSGIRGICRMYLHDYQACVRLTLLMLIYGEFHTVYFADFDITIYCTYRAIEFNQLISFYFNFSNSIFIFKISSWLLLIYAHHYLYIHSSFVYACLLFIYFLYLYSLFFFFFFLNPSNSNLWLPLSIFLVLFITVCNGFS